MTADSTGSGVAGPRSGLAGEGLRFLVVNEDTEGRAAVLEALRAALPGVELIETPDPESLTRALGKGLFDLVVTDHCVGFPDAFAVLAAVRQRFPDRPVILCASDAGEELVLSAMKAGFDDYVRRDAEHLPRLPASVRESLEQGTRRRAAREAESRYRSLFEGVPVGLYRATLTGQIIDANPAMIRLLGFPSRESLMAANLREIHDDAPSRRAFLEGLERGGEVRDLELTWRRYNGQRIAVRQSARPVRDSSGRLLHYEGVVEDVTERKHAREQLQESNQFLQEIVSGAGEGVIVYDRDLSHVVWNRFMEGLTGLPAAELLGRRAPDVFPQLAEQGVLELLRRALEGETVTSSDVAYRASPSGRAGWVIGTYGPHRNAAGEIVGVIGIVHDVTERRRAERALRESEERFRLMADAAPVMVWMDDSGGLCTYFNKTWLEFTGRALEQELGHGWWEGVHPDDLPGFRALYETARGGRKPFQTEYRVRRADQAYRWILDTGVPRFTIAGEFDGFIGSSLDITDRRSAEEALRAQHRFLRTVIDTDPNLVFAKDWNGRFTLANRAVAKLYGTSVEGLIGKTDADFNPEQKEVEHFLRDDREVMSSHRPKLIPEEPVTDPRIGVTRWFQTIKVPLTPVGGGTPQVLGVATDITQRRLAEQALRESEESYRVTAETATDAILTIDEESRILFANAAAERIFGYAPTELVGKSLTMLMPERLRSNHVAGMHRYRDTGVRHLVWDAISMPALHKSGREVPVEISFGESRRGGRRLFTGIVRDVTERRRAEEALRESEARYRTQVENAPEAIVVFDVDAEHFVEVNDNAVGLFKLPRPALLESGPVPLSPPRQPDGRPSEEAAREWIGQALAGGTPVFEWVHRDAEGNDIPCEIRLARLPSASRRLVRGSVTDISARKRAEKLQSALYRIAAATAAAEDLDAFYRDLHRIVGELMYAKNLYVALYDESSDTLSFPYFVDEVDAPAPPKKAGKGLTEYVLRTGRPALVRDEDFPEMITRGDAELVGAPSFDWLGVPLKRGERTFGVLVVQSYDARFRFQQSDLEVLTFVSHQIASALERRRSQEALRESEERYRLLFERNLAGVYRLAISTGRILECNDALARIFGYGSREELLGRDLDELYPDRAGREAFRKELLSARSLANYEMCGRRRDGSLVWTLENASLLADEAEPDVVVEGTVMDVTERRLLEEQLRQSQKMEAVGQLAGGIAHDFNNLLTTVLGYSDMALSRLGPADPMRVEVEEIRRAGERAAELTRQLLAFGRRQVFEPRIVDLNVLVGDAARMLSRVLGEQIRIVTELEPRLGRVRADPGQLEEAIVHLAVNARDSMPAGGTLTFRTSNEPVEPGRAGAAPEAPRPGSWIALSITDTGVGMDAETSQRVFEPFFSTKDKPRATGLGLATVYGIVAQSGGSVSVASEPGRGTTFTILLPRIEEPDPVRASGRDATSPANVSETILLVEDEDAVRELARRLLEGRGYTVLPAAGAEEAAAIAARHDRPLDLLLTDVMMPGATGRELARRILAGRPRTRVLYISGYAASIVGTEGELEPGAAFLQKPFTPDALASKVREVLDEPLLVGGRGAGRNAS